MLIWYQCNDKREDENENENKFAIVKAYALT
jgi:hypothetical protein